MTGLMVLAFGAGLLAPVNPCGFALLPAMLAACADTELTSTAGRLLRGLRAGLALTAGFTAVFVAVGLAVTFGLRSLMGATEWIAVTVGAGYAAASLACTLGVLLAVIAAALAADSPAAIAAVFAAYTAGAAVLLLGMAVTTAVASGALTRSLRRLLPHAGRIAGAILVASGGYLATTRLPLALGRPASADPVETLAARTSIWISANSAIASPSRPSSPRPR